MNTSLDHALHYQKLGFSVVPIKQGEKFPHLKSWKEFENKCASTEQIRTWFQENPHDGVGIICGSVSGVVVLDVDHKENLPNDIFFPPTISVKTNRGYHLYYRIRGNQKIAQANFSWGELRSDGGLVVAPPSIHPSGIHYEWANGSVPILEEIEFLPDELISKLNLAENKSPEKKLYESVLTGEIKEGTRNNTMASLIGVQLKFFPESQWSTSLWNLIQGINKEQCKPPLPADELEKTFNSICNAEKEKTQNTPTLKAEFTIVTGPEMMTLKPVSKPYLVDQLIALRAINAITADTGKGKSLFALILARHIASGQKLFDQFECLQRKVLFIDQEMDGDLIIERFQQVIKDDNANIDYLFEQQWKITDQSSYDWLKKMIVERGYGCIFLDTFTNIHTLDENSSNDMKVINEQLLKLNHETGVTIIYLHHHRKPERGVKANQSSSRGSTEIGAKLTSHLLLESKKEKDRNGNVVTSMTIEQVKSRRPGSVEKIALKVIYNPDQATTTWEYIGEVDKGIDAKQQACVEILELLKENGRMTVKDIKETSSVSDTNLRAGLKILEKLGSVSFVCGGPGLRSNEKTYFLKLGDDY